MPTRAANSTARHMQQPLKFIGRMAKILYPFSAYFFCKSPLGYLKLWSCNTQANFFLNFKLSPIPILKLQ